jgi:methyl-accepting chemotaxis protein
MKSLKFLSLGMWIMRSMRFSTKLTLLSLAVLLPLLAVVVELIAERPRELALHRAELQGVAVVGEASELIRQIQAHRGQTNMVLSGNTAAQQGRDLSREALRRSRAALDQKLANSRAVQTPKTWSALRDRVDALVPALDGKSAQGSFALHTELIEDLGRFVYSLAKESSLLFEADPATYLLMDVAVSRVVPWTEQLGQLRGLGAGLLSQTELNELGAERVRTQLDALDFQNRDMVHALALLAEFSAQEPLANKALQASSAFSRQARERFKAGAASGEAQVYFAAGSQAIEAVTLYQRATLDTIDHLLQARIERSERLLWLSIAASVLGLLVMLYFMLSFHRSFMADLRQVLVFMQQVATGNLNCQANIPGKDELSEMTDAMDTMVKKFSSMVASVRSNAALVSYAGSSMAAGNRALSERTEQQAANLEQTAASVQELSSTVQGNAQAAQQSDAMASGVRDIAESGAQAMSDAIGSVEAIQSSTKRMDEIVGVIDGLAFQTNILALNAAVEAARAGESGRGFAVVASEVRSLAQRSAESAKEIRQLIGASSSQVAVGVAQIRKAGVNINQIVDGIRGVATNMSQISLSSAEQSSSLSEVTAAVRQLDEITQQNASVVERAVNQANDLEIRASTLAETVAGFKLQQGTAEEAMNLVERALTHRRQCGSRDAYLRDLTQADKQFFDRDMYVFALDGHGTYLAFGGNQSKVGTRVQDIAGIDGAGLVEAIINQADQEPGWVEYDITNPASGRVQTKMSFVRELDDLYIGCGVYKNFAA